MRLNLCDDIRGRTRTRTSQCKISTPSDRPRTRSRIAAARTAEELEADFKSKQPIVPHHYSFKYYATRFIEKRRQLAARGDRNASFIKTAQVFLDKNQWGLMKHFAGKDVRELKTQHFAEFINDLAKKRPDLST